MFKAYAVAALVLFSSSGMARASAIDQQGAPRKDLQVFNDVAASVTRYTQYTIFDDVNIGVKDGTVTLSGRVTMPFKRNDIEQRIAKIDGVTEVKDDIEVLPNSMTDDALRHQIARAIYGNDSFWHYSSMPSPSIHIIVDNGRVTLDGVVGSPFDRTMAGMLANRFPAFSVTNNLKTDAEVKDALEHL